MGKREQKVTRESIHSGLSGLRDDDKWSDMLNFRCCNNRTILVPPKVKLKLCEGGFHTLIKGPNGKMYAIGDKASYLLQDYNGKLTATPLWVLDHKFLGDSSNRESKNSRLILIGNYVGNFARREVVTLLLNESELKEFNENNPEITNSGGAPGEGSNPNNPDTDTDGEAGGDGEGGGEPQFRVVHFGTDRESSVEDNLYIVNYLGEIEHCKLNELSIGSERRIPINTTSLKVFISEDNGTTLVEKFDIGITDNLLPFVFIHSHTEDISYKLFDIHTDSLAGGEGYVMCFTGREMSYQVSEAAIDIRLNHNEVSDKLVYVLTDREVQTTTVRYPDEDTVDQDGNPENDSERTTQRIVYPHIRHIFIYYNNPIGDYNTLKSASYSLVDPTKDSG